MKQVKWFDRKFNFDETQNTFPEILERLAGTALRLEDKVKDLPENVLSHAIGDTWTIKENIGHLTDLEPLWQERFTDILNNAPELRHADLQNNKTHQANHNNATLQELLAGFRATRQETIALLADIDEEAVFRSALHPRLKIPMRTIDLFLFVAEHDDHHLARITALIKAKNQ